jgi:elongation factor Ts
MISASQVKELREKTGAGIMECKRALKESEGDLEKAVDALRKQGVIKAAKKSDRSTQEGLIEVAIADDDSQAAIVEVNCETDFVARTDDFQNFVKELAADVLASRAADVATLLKGSSMAVPGKKIEEVLQAVIAKLGENIDIARFDVLAQDDSKDKIGYYIHPGNQIGVLLKVSSSKVSQEQLRDIAMHIAAMNPQYASADCVPEDVAEREKAILKGAEDLANKPENVVTKIIEGRFKKFLSENCLSDQIFVKDPDGKNTVGQFLKKLDPDSRILTFIRYLVGERPNS